MARHSLDQAAILDCESRALKSPRGDRPPRYLRRPLFILLDLVTRRPGAIVGYDALQQAIWPDAYKPIDAQMSLYVYANTVRALLAEMGWPRDVLVTRIGVGLQFDKDLALEALDAVNGVSNTD